MTHPAHSLHLRSRIQGDVVDTIILWCFVLIALSFALNILLRSLRHRDPPPRLPVLHSQPRTQLNVGTLQPRPPTIHDVLNITVVAPIMAHYSLSPTHPAQVVTRPLPTPNAETSQLDFPVAPDLAAAVPRLQRRQRLYISFYSVRRLFRYGWVDLPSDPPPAYRPASADQLVALEVGAGGKI